MSLSYVVDPAQSFTAVFFMSAVPRDEYQKPGSQEYSPDGTPKWTCQVAATTPQKGKRPPQSEVLTVTVTAARNPAGDIPQGSPVTLEGLEIGASAPEKRENGGGIRGGRIWHTATGISQAYTASRSSSKSADAA